MKKITFLFLLFAALFALNTGVKAQSYFTYDGSEFSVLLTCDDANTYVTALQFSSGGNWIDFSIIDYTDLEGVAGGGFAYTCQDGKGVKFLVDYYRTQDYIKVMNLDTGKEWTLYRRSE